MSIGSKTMVAGAAGRRKQVLQEVNYGSGARHFYFRWNYNELS